MTKSRLAVIAAFVALLGIAASSAAEAGQCQTRCYRSGNQTVCDQHCF